MNKTIILSGLLAILVSPAIVYATTLTFDDATCAGVACSNGGLVDQSYGDILNVIDIRWDADKGGTLDPLHFWSSGYIGLSDVGYGNSDKIMEIFFDPAPGYEVTLHGFHLSSSLPGRPTSVTVLTGIDQVLYSTGDISISGFESFDLTDFGRSLTSGDGLRLEFGPDAYNVAIDNIEFSVAPAVEIAAITVGTVPVPAVIWLFGPGLLSLFGIARGRAS